MSSELLDQARHLLNRARDGEEVEIYLMRADETEVRAFEGAVESLSSASSAGVGIRVLMGSAPGSEGSRVGFAWAGSLDAEVVKETMEAARANARFATPDPHLALAEPDDASPSELDLWRPGTASTDEKVAATIELERATRAADPRIRQVASADYGDGWVETAIASTRGVRAWSRRTSAFLSVSAIAGEGIESQTGSGFSVGRNLGELDPDEACRDAVDRSVRMLGAGRARPTRCTVVFDPRVTSTILSVVASALSGEMVVKGRSFFADRIGEQVAAPGVTLVDDPTEERAHGAAIYDAEGLSCRRNVLIQDGDLRQFVYDTVAARRAGTVSTGSAIRGGYSTTPGAGCRAVLLAPGTMDHAEVLAAVGEGFYVQSVTGVHSGVNPVSGDFSVGAEGLLIDHGQLSAPIREATVASTLQRMLHSVVHVGADLRWGPGVAAGQTLAVGDMQMSGSGD